MQKTIILFFILVSTITCKKKELKNNHTIIALGHSGMGVGNLYPMNSNESILTCLNLGMDGTEFDVQMTKDSVLVAYHDKELSNQTNLKGLINDLSWDELKKAQYTQTPYLNYSIVSLDQLFSSIDNIQQYKFTFDCKLYTNNDFNQFYATYINALTSIIQKYNLENNIYIESHIVEFITLLKAKKPDYRIFIHPSSFEFGLYVASTLNLYGITIAARDITKEQVQIAHNNNLSIAVWNTHTESDHIKAINKNPDFIQTDNVKNLLKLLK